MGSRVSRSTRSESGEHSLYYQVRLDPWFERVKFNQHRIRGTFFIPPSEIRPMCKMGQGPRGLGKAQAS